MIIPILEYKGTKADTPAKAAAGAGTMTSLLSLRAEYYVYNIIVAIIINILIVYIILKSSKKIQTFLVEDFLTLLFF